MPRAYPLSPLHLLLLLLLVAHAEQELHSNNNNSNTVENNESRGKSSSIENRESGGVCSECPPFLAYDRSGACGAAPQDGGEGMCRSRVYTWHGAKRELFGETCRESRGGNKERFGDDGGGRGDAKERDERVKWKRWRSRMRGEKVGGEGGGGGGGGRGEGECMGERRTCDDDNGGEGQRFGNRHSIGWAPGGGRWEGLVVEGWVYVVVDHGSTPSYNQSEIRRSIRSILDSTVYSKSRKVKLVATGPASKVSELLSWVASSGWSGMVTVVRGSGAGYESTFDTSLATATDAHSKP